MQHLLAWLLNQLGSTKSVDVSSNYSQYSASRKANAAQKVNKRAHTLCLGIHNQILTKVGNTAAHALFGCSVCAHEMPLHTSNPLHSASDAAGSQCLDLLTHRAEHLLELRHLISQSTDFTITRARPCSCTPSSEEAAMEASSSASSLNFSSTCTRTLFPFGGGCCCCCWPLCCAGEVSSKE